MKYLSTKEISNKWNIDQSLVLRLLKSGRIEGAIKIGNSWAIPFDAIKPIDKRTKKSKLVKEDIFRFPIYINFDENSYSPLLNNDEKKLRTAQIHFYKGELDNAKEILESLIDESKNRYICIASLYHLLVIYKLENSNRFNNTLLKFNAELSEDFPYKKEMMLFKYFFDMDNTNYKSLLEEFNIDPNYKYHESCFAFINILNLIPIENGDFTLMSKLRFDTQELLCQQMEKYGYYMEAQKLHFLLLVIYQLQNNKERMLFHTSKAIELGNNHNLYLYIAYYHRLYPETIDKVLIDYPLELSSKIHNLSNLMIKSDRQDALSSNNPSYIALLSGKELKFAFLVNQGYSNKEIGDKLGISEKLVSKRYTEIYDKLNVKNKQELIYLINNTHRNGSI